MVARERKREANNLLQMEPQNSQIGADPIEIPVDPQYQQQFQQQQSDQQQKQPQQHQYQPGVNPGYSREQSVYSQASGYSHQQRGAYM